MNIPAFQHELQQDLPFLSLSLALSALLLWLVNSRLRQFVPTPGRQLATLFVAIHTLLFAIHYAAFLPGAVFLPLKLWHYDGEWTIASVNSSFSSLLLASLCLLNGIGAGKIRVPERLYWMFLAVAFTGMCLFEYAALPRYIIPETIVVVSFGLFLVAFSLLLALRHRGDVVRRFCLLLLPAGMGLWGLGFRIDETTILGNPHVGPLEETLELLGMAVALAGVAGYATTNLPRSRIQGSRFLASLCLTNVILFSLLLAAPVWEERVFPEARFLWRTFGHRINADIGDGSLALRGWNSHSLSPGLHGRVHVVLQALKPIDFEFGFSAQLIDQASGENTLTINKRSGINVRKWPPGLEFAALLKAPLHVTEATPTNRAQWLTVSFWKIEGDDFPPLKIDSSDYPLLSDTHVILDELVLHAPAGSFGQNEALAVFANGFALQQAILPERAQVGEPIEVAFQWSSVSDGEEDWTQFLHFVPEDGGSFWNLDQYPLGMRLPTRLWYAGLLSDEQWNFTLPADLTAGTYKVYTGLYRLADLQRLEVTLADGQQPDERSIPLGSISIEN